MFLIPDSMSVCFRAAEDSKPVAETGVGPISSDVGREDECDITPG